MDTDEFPSNSRASANRAQDKKREPVAKVVSGEVRLRKPPLRKRLAQVFIAEDSTNVGRYILFEVLVPAAKDLITDIISQSVDRTLYGARGGKGRPSQRFGGTPGYVSYNRFGQQGQRQEERPQFSRQGRVRHSFDEIILATRAEATEVIDRLFDLISRYEQATVSDLLDLVGLEAKFTDDNYGWRDIRGAGATRVNGGYLLDLPRPEQLN